MEDNKISENQKKFLDQNKDSMILLFNTLKHDKDLIALQEKNRKLKESLNKNIKK